MSKGTIRGHVAFLSPPSAALLRSNPVSSNKRMPSNRTPTRYAARTNITMLRVQKKRRPEEWDKNMSNLSGRFLPMDPRDENILNALEAETVLGSDIEESYGPDGPPASAYGDYAPSTKKWSKRSEAARKRWADPVYRERMLKKRAEKKQRDAEAAGGPPKPKVEIGRMDSITLCNDDKAKAINDYVRSNKLRSEKITAFHRDRRQWMENRLKDSPARLTDDEYLKRKLELRERRRSNARKREEAKRAKQGGNSMHME